MGQTCVAPDYLIVDRQNERIIDMIELEFNLAKEEMLKLPKIINEKHYLRLKAYLTELGLERFDDEKSNHLSKHRQNAKFRC